MILRRVISISAALALAVASAPLFATRTPCTGDAGGGLYCHGDGGCNWTNGTDVIVNPSSHVIASLGCAG